jgi:hypothetical protein
LTLLRPQELFTNKNPLAVTSGHYFIIKSVKIMTHKSKQSSGSKKDYASLYASLLEQKLPSGPRPKWDKISNNRDKFNTLDEYYKAAYLALKADLRSLNKNKKTTSFDDQFANAHPSVIEFCKLRLEQILKRGEQNKEEDPFTNASPSVKEFCRKQLQKLKELNENNKIEKKDNALPYVNPNLLRQIEPDRLN